MSISTPKVRHRSSAYAAPERFARWQAVIGGSFDDATGRRSAHEDAVFDVDSSMWNLGKGLLFHSRFKGRQVKHRSMRRIRADHLDHYRIHLQRSGSERNDAQGRYNVLQAGDVLITDMAREERYALEHSECTVLVVPREMLEEALPRPMDLHGAVPRGATLQMLRSHLTALAASADRVAAEEAPALMAATVQLVAGAIAGSQDVRLDAAPAVAPSTLRQLCRYIDLHLDDASLSGDTLVATFGLSRTTLYRMFGPLGGVQRFIRERRLNRVHEALSRGGKRINLARLAADHGFTTASHFSRAFREQFGYSPSEVQQGGDSMRHARAARDAALEQSAAGCDALNLWLRSLRD